MALDDSLVILERRDPRQAEVVLLRFFVGLTMREIAEQIDVSVSTEEADWRLARAWLLWQFHE